MFHEYATRFDVTGNLEGELNKAQLGNSKDMKAKSSDWNMTKPHLPPSVLAMSDAVVVPLSPEPPPSPGQPPPPSQPHRPHATKSRSFTRVSDHRQPAMTTISPPCEDRRCQAPSSDAGFSHAQFLPHCDPRCHRFPHPFV